MSAESPTISILGGSLSGNKGAASMVLAVLDGMRRRFPNAMFRIFSPYAVEDSGKYPHLEIVAYTPADMVLCLPAACLSMLTGRRWKPKRGVAGELSRTDVVADVSGVAFMDGRGAILLVYNVLLVLIPLAFGVRVVKVAQALGPFRHRVNRAAARLVLRRVSWVGLRGAGTVALFRDLRLTNGEYAADVTFLLETGAEDEAAATAALPVKGSVTLIVPSTVVERACAKAGIDYVGRMATLARRLAAAGHEVVFVAHSAREGATAGRTNDLPLCRRIAAESPASFIDRELEARALRALIGRSRLLITSRFHGMISGLVTRTPTFVISWSHKYREVLAEFGLEHWAKDFRSMEEDELYASVLRLDSEREGYIARIDSCLPDVIADAERNIDRLATIARERL